MLSVLAGKATEVLCHPADQREDDGLDARAILVGKGGQQVQAFRQLLEQLPFGLRLRGEDEWGEAGKVSR